MFWSARKPFKSNSNDYIGKDLVPEIWAKMISANYIAEFLNWLYLQKKMMIFCMLMQINGNWLENIGIGVVRNRCGYFGHWKLKLME